MRDFLNLQNELNIIPFAESENGMLFAVHPTAGMPRLVIRRFDGNLPPKLVGAYASLLHAAGGWIERYPELANVVRVEQPTEIGRDFIARPHHLGTPLTAYYSDEDPSEAPDELEVMQSSFRNRKAAADSPRDKLLAAVLARSILEPTSKTRHSYDEDKFVIVDLKPTREDLEAWAALNPDTPGGRDGADDHR